MQFGEFNFGYVKHIYPLISQLLYREPAEYVWHNKNPSSVTAPSLTNSFSTRFRGNEAIFAADRDWGQWSQIETCISKTKNKSKPKLRIWWISGRIQYDHTASPRKHFAPLDTLSLPSYSHCFTFAHLFANESFHLQLKCHSRQAKARHQGNNKSPDLCFYDQQKQEKTKHHII